MQKKIKIFEEIKNTGISHRKIAKKYNVSKTTINKLWINHVSGKTNEKSYVLNIHLENAVLNLLNKLRKYNYPVSGSIIRKYAKEISIKLGIRSFKASNGWFEKFKKRNNLSFKILSGESKSADSKAASSFLTNFNDNFKDYEKENIFNCDETALFWKNFPRKSFVLPGDDCKGLIYFIKKRNKNTKK